MITQTIELKALTEEKLIRVPMVQWDSGRVLQCTITDMQIPDEATAIFRAEKKSGVIYNTGIIDGDKIKIPITAQTLAEPGFLPCQIEIRNKEDVVKTFRFNIYVHSAIAEAGEESKPESTYFDKLIERAETAAENAEKSETESGNYARIAENAVRSAVESAQTAGENAQNAVESAKTAELSAQSATQSAESAKQSDQSAAESKMQAAQSAQNAADSARSAEESQTQAAQSTQSAKQAAQSAAESQTQAAGSAGSAAESAESAGESQTQAMQSAESAKQDAQSAAESAESAKSDADRAQAILDSIPEDYTEMHGKIIDLQEEVGRKAPAIILTAEGEDLVIRGSADAPIQDMELTGKTEQVQTTGKNILNSYGYSATSMNNPDAQRVLTNNYGTEISTIDPENTLTITQTQADGDSVSYQNGYFCIGINDEIKNGSAYYFSADINIKSNPLNNTEFRIMVNGSTAFSSYFELSQKKFRINVNFNYLDINNKKYIEVRCCGMSFDISNIMISESSATYESYTGGKPSPSPEYKQDIVNAQSPVQVEVMGKNLFNSSKIQTVSNEGATLTNNGDGSFTISGSGTLTGVFSADYFDDNVGILKPGRISIISNSEGVYFYFQLKNSSGDNMIYLTNATTNANITDDMIRDAITMRFGFYGSTGSRIPNTEYCPMVYQFGDGTAEPYKQPQTITITSDRPITKWDKLVKQNGVWGWMYKSNEVEFDGSEDEEWKNYTPQSGFYITGNMKAGARLDGFCDKLANIKTGYSTGIIFGLGDSRIYFVQMVEYATTLDQWKTWLQSNPVKVLYETENTEFVPLPQEEQGQINKLRTYGPTTVIITDPQMGTKIDYVADTKTYIDSKFAEIAMQLIEAISEK